MDNILIGYLQRRQTYESSRSPAASQESQVGHSGPRGSTSIPRQLASALHHEQSGVRPGPLEGAGDVIQVVVPQHRGWIDNVVRDVATASPKKQIVIGGVSGLASGYVVGKVGRAALLAVGGSLILLQIAHYQGLIQVNWTNVENSLATTRRRINQQVAGSSLPGLVEDVTEFGRRHVYLAGSFFAGFLVGLIT